MKIKYRTPEEKWLESPRWADGVFALNSTIPVFSVFPEHLIAAKTNDKRMLKLIKKRYKKVEIKGSYVYYENKI